MIEENNNTNNLSIYKAARTIKRKDNTLYNILRSIYEDSIFVREIAQLWPELPLLANLRCGLWYAPKFHTTCYFKSTDGHNNNWSFNTSRLNLHVALLAALKGGCIIVDSTKKGKRFPDSMSKTIPIWTCIFNRAIRNHMDRMRESGTLTEDEGSIEWDISLHLPLWVSQTERAAIEERLEDWTRQLEASGVDIGSLASCLKKPLRPLWISQRTVIWINEVPEASSWDFTPIILLNASASSGFVQHRTTSEFSWNYIPGAGDDEESWARGLSPSLFWNNVYDIINSGPDVCNQKVADLVEKYRVYRSRRGYQTRQVLVKPIKSSKSMDPPSCNDQELSRDSIDMEADINSCGEDSPIYWLGSTNVAVGATEQVSSNTPSVDCTLNCDCDPISVSNYNSEAYLHLRIQDSKFNRFSLLKNLPDAVHFARLSLVNGKTLLICCKNGEDISICVSLAILMSLFNDQGAFDDGKSFKEKCITKLEMRRRLVYICKYAIKARPSRGNLKQVYAFLTGKKFNSD